MPRLRPVKNEPAPPPIIPPPQEVEAKEDVVVDLTEQPTAPETVEVEAKAPGPPPPEEDISALKKRIEELTKAEAAAKEQAAAISAREQRIRELERQALEHQQRFQERESDVYQAQLDSVINAIGAAQAEIETAKRDLRTAAESQDWERLADAQERIGRSSADLSTLERNKASLEVHREEARKPPPEPQQRLRTFDDIVAELPETLRPWARSHPIYWQDGVEYQRLNLAHIDAGRAGIAFGSPDYIEFVETKLGIRKSERQQEEPRVEVMTSAPPSRESPSMESGRRPSATSMRLTPEQQEVARINGLSNVEYAKQLLRLQEEKKRGNYT